MTIRYQPTIDEKKEILTLWNLSQPVYEQLSKHYLLHWSREYFLKQAVGNNWIIESQGYKYIVLFEMDKTFIDISSKHGQIALSFRLINGSDTYGYVLIRGIK